MLQLRNDQLTLVCDDVRRYQEDGMPPPSVNGNGKPHSNGSNRVADATSNGASYNGAASNGHGKGAAANGHKNGTAAAERVAPPQPAAQTASNGAGHRTVSLVVKESNNATEDAHLLREVIGVVLEYFRP